MPGPTTESLATDFRDSSRELTQFRENVAGFQGRVETKLSIIQWLGAFFATVLMSVIASLIWLAWHASAINQRVGVLEQTTAKVVDRLDKIDERFARLEREIVRSGERLDKLDQLMTRIADRLDHPLGPDKPQPTHP